MGGTGSPGAGPARPDRHTVLRYLGFQVPGWGAVGIAGWAAHEWLALPAWLCAVGLALWVVKDAAMFPFVWKAYAPATGEHARLPAGTPGVAEDALDPVGYVRVGSELWKARLAAGSAPVAAGEAVRVRAVHGLTLEVEPSEGADR